MRGAALVPSVRFAEHTATPALVVRYSASSEKDLCLSTRCNHATALRLGTRRGPWQRPPPNSRHLNRGSQKDYVTTVPPLGLAEPPEATE